MRATIWLFIALFAPTAASAQAPPESAVRTAGNGPVTWVLLSGLVGGTAGFRALERELLAEGHRVVTIDPYHLSIDSADVSFAALARRVNTAPGFARARRMEVHHD